MRLLRAALPHLRFTRPTTASTATATATTSSIANSSGRSSQRHQHARPRPPLPPTPSIAHNAPHNTADVSPSPYLRASSIYSLSPSYNTSATACHPPRPGHGHDCARSPARTGAADVASLWPRGTWDDPVPIPSAAASRVVACTGPLCSSSAPAAMSPFGQPALPFAQPHATVWITVEHNRPRQCPDCGQVFKLARRAEGQHTHLHPQAAVLSPS